MPSDLFNWVLIVACGLLLWKTVFTDQRCEECKKITKNSMQRDLKGDD